jgi:hypothetical protein
MVEFLTPEWLSELDSAARRSSALAGLGADGGIVIEQHIRGAPFGDVRYHLAIDDSGARVHAGPADDPTLLIVIDYASAVALHQGTTNLQRTLASGTAQLRGDLRRLARHAEALGAVDDVFATVRAMTTYAPSA